MFKKDLPISYLGLAVASNRAAGQAQRKAARDALARIAELEDILAVKMASIAGFEAQIMAFAAQHPDSPLMVDSGQRFKESENIKRTGRLIYEAAFDASLSKLLGIADPASRRLD